MGGRQSQEPAAPAPLDVAPPLPTRCSRHRTSLPPPPSPPSHCHSSPEDASPSRLPTLSDYPHLQPAARPHSLSASQRLHQHQSLGGSRSSSPADQLLELNIALSTLQQRLQARAEARQSSTLHAASLPPGLPLLFFRPVSTLQCPICSKDVVSSGMEAHMSQCVRRPRVTYNADTLAQQSGECSICLEDMVAGEEIARLPCLCIYHLKCAQQWFKVSQTCPEHPDLA